MKLFVLGRTHHVGRGHKRRVGSQALIADRTDSKTVRATLAS
ncbi:hypothetical protein [Nonomuraea sp. 10N515B]